MNSSKRYNQILFLMTFSVYMGLVLAGGASPALAQAAMAKGFELKTELEAKDDLDKKPDNDEEEIKQLTSSMGRYLDEMEDLFDSLKALHQTEKFDLSQDIFSVESLSYVPCNVSGDPVRRTESRENISSEWLRAFIKDVSFEEFTGLSDCLPNHRFQSGKAFTTGLNFSYDKSVLKIASSLKKESPQKAKQLLENLQTAYKAYEPDEDSPVEKVLYENTRINSGNDQVFIVTNLPRAGLDSLLAAK